MQVGIIAPALVLAVALAGCGDDAESTDAAEPTTTTTVAPATTTTAAPATTTTAAPATTTTAASTTTTEQQVALETMQAAADTIVELLNKEDVAGLLDLLGEASLSTSIGVYGGPASDSVDALVRSLGFLTAVDTTWAIAGCEPTGSSGRLACVVPAVVPLHESFGLPAVNSDMMLNIADDGSVTRFAWAFAPAESQELLDSWLEGVQPFYDWMAQTYPEDLEVMLTDTHGLPQSDDAALELWSTRVPEYLALQEG